ncbi:hypothetical protein PMW03_00440 [Clostridium paraputrificum]|uniref:hypothetical protein n=1 Tax=Clostridium paraputrificum TaxID=29363 RepID=UPI001898B6BB|nr:hypothetical protein [Clostridium paraputrificum]MDB2108604.1 hypothetical protein [Clostridium paraputrificum]
MSTILLSFEPDWFSFLESGKKKFEYRKHFPTGEDTTVYFYVSQPVKAITGIAHFGKRENLSDWLAKYSARPQEVKDRINDFMTDCRYAVPMKTFTKTNKIPLDKLRNDLPNFIVPRMYYYIDDSELLEYLQTNLLPTEDTRINDFSFIADIDIC